MTDPHVTTPGMGLYERGTTDSFVPVPLEVTLRRGAPIHARHDTAPDQTVVYPPQPHHVRGLTSRLRLAMLVCLTSSP